MPSVLSKTTSDNLTVLGQASVYRHQITFIGLTNLQNELSAADVCCYLFFCFSLTQHSFDFFLFLFHLKQQQIFAIIQFLCPIKLASYNVNIFVFVFIRCVQSLTEIARQRMMADGVETYVKSYYEGDFNPLRRTSS